MPVTCPYCSREFKGEKLNARHLSKCNPASKTKPLPCLCGHESTSLTQMKRHRRGCDAWKNRDKQAVQEARTKAAFEQRYGEGVTNARHVPEAEARRKATVQKRYGAENVFSKGSSLFEQVQASLEGKRLGLQGEDNPFARPEVQEKIRQHWQREHGVENVQQVPEIRARTKATNLERYGGELLGSPELAAKARVTNLERYGDEFPQRTDEVKERTQATNMERYGVPWTAMDPDVRRKQLEAMEAQWGSHFFASDEGKKIVRQGMLDKYGVEHAAQMEGHWERMVATFQERYGVDHPLQLEEFQEKQVRTMQERHGWDYFIGSDAYKAWSQEKYGTDHPMQNREYARQHLEKMSRPGINFFEQRVASLAPPKTLLYTGDGSWWRWLPKLGKHKNPDFVLPGPDPEHPFRGVTKIVEAFGDFWHSRMFTGKAPFDHEQELVDAFADVGIDCLIIWESEVRGKGSDPEAVRTRLESFLAG